MPAAPAAAPVCEFCASADFGRRIVRVRERVSARVHRMTLCGSCMERPFRTIWRRFELVEGAA